jgi:phosphotransferase system HPr (HPr) family protein
MESAGEVKVRAPLGLSATLARAVVEVARGFVAASSLTVYDGRGRSHRADARNLLELLLLGAGRGDAVRLQCVGPDARVAREAIAAVLGQTYEGPYEGLAADEEAQTT